MSPRRLLCKISLKTWTSSILLLCLIVAALISTTTGDAQTSKFKVDDSQVQVLLTMNCSDWSIDQYDVLPDRVVVYLWPRAGGTEFEFKFRNRMAMTAKSSPSSIYDYYNPDAKAVVGPGTFVIK